MRLLLNSDSSGGTGAPGGPLTEPTTASATPPASTAVPAPPPAATTVATGEITEETIKLREVVTTKDAEIEALKKQLKLHEITVCEYQDKLHAITSPSPMPIKQKQPKPRGIRAGVFIEPEE